MIENMTPPFEVDLRERGDAPSGLSYVSTWAQDDTVLIMGGGWGRGTLLVLDRGESMDAARQIASGLGVDGEHVAGEAEAEEDARDPQAALLGVASGQDALGGVRAVEDLMQAHRVFVLTYRGRHHVKASRAHPRLDLVVIELESSYLAVHLLYREPVDFGIVGHTGIIKGNLTVCISHVRHVDIHHPIQKL